MGEREGGKDPEQVIAVGGGKGCFRSARGILGIVTGRVEEGSIGTFCRRRVLVEVMALWLWQSIFQKWGLPALGIIAVGNRLVLLGLSQSVVVVVGIARALGGIIVQVVIIRSS